MSNGIVNIHGKDYKTVALRVTEFHQKYEGAAAITTDIVSADESKVVMKCTIYDNDSTVMATGFAEENRNNGNINRTSALENCETSAIGRALAALGFAGEEYCSADEMSQAAIDQKTKEITDWFAKASEKLREHWENISVFKTAIATEDYTAAVEAWYEIPQEDWTYFNLAPTKGGILSTKERGIFKSDEWSQARNEYFGHD